METPNRGEPTFSDEETPIEELPQSFGIEFGTSEFMKIQKALLDMGFAFRGSNAEEETVMYKGERANGDGTKITIEIQKGDQYISPYDKAKQKGA
jgi:hypothetical protein